MVQVTAAVEHDLVDALGLGALSDQLANGCVAAALLPPLPSNLFVQRGRRDESVAPLTSSMIWA